MRYAYWDPLSWYWKCKSLTFTFKTWRFEEIRLVHTITCYTFELESSYFHHIFTQFSRLVLERGVIDHNLQGHFDSELRVTAFDVALIHRYKPAKGCYTSQTCSCFEFCDRITCCKSASMQVFPPQLLAAPQYFYFYNVQYPIKHAHSWASFLRKLHSCTVRCRYNAVNFHPNPHKRHPITRPWGRASYRVYFVSPVPVIAVLYAI